MAKNTYKQYTIGSLMQELKDLLAENKYLNMNSPIFIGDFNMSSFKYEFSPLPSFSQAQHTAGICLFHSLNEEPVEAKYNYDTEDVEPFIEEVEEEPIREVSSIMKFAKWIKA